MNIKYLKIIDVFIRKQIQTPYGVKNKLENPDADPICLTESNFDSLKEKLLKKYSAEFAKKNGKYISYQRKITIPNTADAEFNLEQWVEENGRKLSELIEEVEVNEAPIPCMSSETLQQLDRLIYWRIQSSLLKIVWEDLPNGKELLKEAEDEFERVCSEAKLPRRTSAIIKANKEKKMGGLFN